MNSKMINVSVLTLIGFLYVGQLVPALGQFEAYDRFAWIEAVVDSTMKAENIPALSLGIVMDGKLVYAEGFGVQERDLNKPVDGETLYQIGSDTKKITAIIAKRLALEGQLDFNAPIVSYLDDLITNEAREKLKTITLKELLLHRSGVPYRAPTTRRIDGDPMLIPYSEKDLIHDLNTMNLAAEPGIAFGYSNFGYAIAGFICERASGKTYAMLVQKYVAEELGMTRTRVDPSDAEVQRMAIPYREGQSNDQIAALAYGQDGGRWRCVLDYH